MKNHWTTRFSGDFCDYLPLFSSDHGAFAAEGEAYDFGISDIRFVPGLDEALRSAMENFVEGAIASASRLPGMQGYQPLCEEMATLIFNETGLATSYEQVVLTDGGCDGIVLAALTACGDSGGVAYAVPSFPYWWVFSHGGIPQVPVIFSSPSDYVENFAGRMIDACEAEPRIMAIILNEPHNPLGIPLPKSSLTELADYITRRGLTVIMDDVGRGLVRSTYKTWWGSCFPQEQTIVVDSFTKRYGMPGLRLGFVRCDRTNLVGVRGRIANCRAGVSNVAAHIGMGLVEQLRKTNAEGNVRIEIENRLSALRQTLNEIIIPSIHFELPHWGMYCVLDCMEFHQSTGITGRELATILHRHGVRIMDDRFLFPPALEVPQRENYLRLSVGAERNIAIGLQQLGNVLRELAD